MSDGEASVSSAIQLRWSSIYAFMKCMRKYDLSYRQHLVKRTGADNRARVLGSHVHAGIEAALRASFAGEKSVTKLVTAAVNGVRTYNRNELKEDQKRYDWETKTFVPDTAYFSMMADVLISAIAIIRYQVPRIGLGTRYRVATIRDVMGDTDMVDGDIDRAMIEWNFNVPIILENGNAYILSGTVDSVLQDIKTGEYIIFDWKCRAIIPPELLVDLDGQLKFYAAVINKLGGKISQTCQYQIRSNVPQPAKLTDKTKKVSTQNISSTWEVWAESVRALGLNPDDYADTMKPKMKDETAFTCPIRTPVTPISAHLIMNNVLQIGEAIRYAEEHSQFPAIPSSVGCQFCEFKSYCRVADHGGDLKYIIETEYDYGLVDEDEFDTVEE
jgi:hypothetical protein